MGAMFKKVSYPMVYVAIYTVMIKIIKKYVVGYSVNSFREIENSMSHFYLIIPAFLQILKHCY